MTATVPASLAFPLLACMAAVVALRYIFYNHSQWERYLNHTLAFMLAANLIRERAIQDGLRTAGIMTITTAQQLSLALMIFTAAEFMGFITMWAQIPPQEARRRHRYHRLAATLLAAAFLIAATPARTAGQTLEVRGGWTSVTAWAFCVFLLCVLAVHLISMCVEELQRPSAQRQELFVAASGLILGLSIGITSIEAPVLAALEELGWLHSSDYRTTLHGFNFFAESVGANILAAIPFFLAAAARAGCDSTSRRWRKLQPLRDSMIAAVPEAAFTLKAPNVSRRKTQLDLHQTTVQIRDCILQLRPYFHDVPDTIVDTFLTTHSVPATQRRDAVVALQLANAVSAKAFGMPAAPASTGLGGRSRSANLEDETSELLRLARWWPAATAHNQQSESERDDAPQRRPPAPSAMAPSHRR